ncbi:PP2C family protein-serine/threonine phosphatase [Streptomyces mashuensis]|uniref:PP2C family protein-serine/threonine phosphatase n=1 Tax=Streptomyces mashuensis TaxID=33904 RepID=UPI001E45F23D|nr:PP2C family protein-serine/threonine phosphatase [Streptomyces mashuensis]
MHPLRGLVRWLPAALIAGGVLFDLLTPAKYSSAPFFISAPLVAAALLAGRATLGAALAALAATVVLAFVRPAPEVGESLTEVVTELTVGVLALCINRIVRSSVRKLASARCIAEAAQLAVLPAPPARISGLRVAARYVAAEADARIGGDLYAVQDTPHGVRVIVGDVRGKGLGAVEAVAVVIGAFREAAEQERTLEGLAARLERALQREGARRPSLDAAEGFTTAVLAEVPPGGSVLRMVNRGHPAPLLLHPDGRAREVSGAAPALPLGMGELGTWPDKVTECAFPAGATLLLFTDGVTEARDADGSFYDPQGLLHGRQFRNPEALLDALTADVARHAGGRAADDMALLAIRRGDGRHRPAVVGSALAQTTARTPSRAVRVQAGRTD